MLTPPPLGGIRVPVLLILVMVLAPLFRVQTLPALSTEMPAGWLRPATT